MSNLKDLISNIKIQQTESNESFVIYYQDTGKIDRIANRRPLELDENIAVIVVPTETVKPILEGTKSADDYIIIYDFAAKQIVVKLVNYEDHYNTADNFIHEFTKTNTQRDGHSTLDEVYKGVTVNIWLKSVHYNKDDLVWYQGAVYKLLKDSLKNQDWDTHSVNVFVRDVKLTDLPTIDHVLDLEIVSPIYEGIHVDVWYDDLSHVQGQHVWHNNTVYVMTEDQKKNTKFKKKNCKVVEENVILYNDENKHLKFADADVIGDKFLNNNKLYIREVSPILQEKQQGTVFYYAGNKHVIDAREDELIVVDLINHDIFTFTEFNVTPASKLSNGDMILNGNKLFLYHVDKKFDLLIRQDNLNNCWELILNPYTKKFLKTAGYTSNDTIFLSITEKYDPNILYKTINIPVFNLIDNESWHIEFDEGWDANTEVSIYTTKYFENYGYEVVN